MKVLLIFDLNGTLILRRKGEIHTRKNLKELKDFCFSIADIGIYTSMLYKNLKLEEIFSKEEEMKLKFIWDRSKTLKDEDGVNEWDTIKSLDNLIIEFPHYDKIIIIDDSHKKVRYIDNKNKIIIPSFTDHKEKENVLINLIDEIKFKLI